MGGWTGQLREAEGGYEGGRWIDRLMMGWDGIGLDWMGWGEEIGVKICGMINDVVKRCRSASSKLSRELRAEF